MDIPDNCTFKDIFDPTTGKYLLKAVPNMEKGIVSVKQMGGMTSINYRRSSLAPGVNTHAVHDFNVYTGSVKPDEETTLKRQSESKRTSAARAKATIRELIACNPWDYFVTITLSPDKWNRQHPAGLQSTISTEAKRWRRMQINKARPYRNYTYLLVLDVDGNHGYHLHGFVHQIPTVIRKQENLIPYTMADVDSDEPLPQYICNAVRQGKKLYHCAEWDDLFGYNLLEQIRDKDRTANYATKYITKNMNRSDFPTRYWHSRGLMRARTIEEHRVLPSTENQYRDAMSAIAAVTPSGKPMQYNYYYPTTSDDEERRIAGINTIVDAHTMTTEQVCDYLEKFTVLRHKAPTSSHANAVIQETNK